MEMKTEFPKSERKLKAALEVESRECEDADGSCIFCVEDELRERKYYIPGKNLRTWIYALVLDDDPSVKYELLQVDVCSKKGCNEKASKAVTLHSAVVLSFEEWKELAVSLLQNRPGAATRHVNCDKCYCARSYTAIIYSFTEDSRGRKAKAFRFCEDHSEALKLLCQQ